MKPEERARQRIDEMLQNAGWVVQDRDKVNLRAGRGIALREFSVRTGAADYVLLVERKVVGVVEAKPSGHTLLGVREQSAKYLDALDDYMPARTPLPFHYETTGVETRFTSYLDPVPRSRPVLSFHQPETLRACLAQAPEQGENDTLRERLLRMPALAIGKLRECQVEAITNLERSFRENHPRALIQMATGSGKTYTAVNFIYRLIKYAGARRVLFLVDRDNLGIQTFNEFQQFMTPDDGRKFTELYNVQHLQGKQIDPVSRVCITNIQRLYSLLKNEQPSDEQGGSLFEQEEADTQPPQEPKHVSYNPAIPIETFDVIVTDECHRSIYNLWREVLEYFDAFLIGLTATPNKQTFGFFNQNLVMEYGHARAVADGVNVDYMVYDIRTKITEQGSTIEKGYYVDRRDRRTRQLRWEEAGDDITYSAEQLDREVTTPDQMRTVLRAFKDALFTDLFPERGKGGRWELRDVPKTLIFAKDDSHAEDITDMVMEVFGAGNNFVQKITYRTTGRKPEELISEFRNNPFPRIAVTVDMISTGTDIKPLEILLFMRKVKSKNFFEQMKGRGTRVIDDESFAQVTPYVPGGKTHFVLVDAVGVYESAKTDEPPLEREPAIPLQKVLQDVALGRWKRKPELLSTLLTRLSRIRRRLGKPGMERAAANLYRLSGGKDVHSIIMDLSQALDPDVCLRAAQVATDLAEPGAVALREARESLASAALLPFDLPEFREALLDIQARDEQIVDTVSPDTLLTSGWNVQARDAARLTVTSFREYIEAHKNEITALQIFYSQPRHAPLTEETLHELAEAIAAPPLHLTTDKLWQAYEALAPARVYQGSSPRRTLTDLVALLRYTMVYESDENALLEPYRATIERRFAAWLAAQEQQRGQPFDEDQRKWLELIRDTIANSLTIERQDFELGRLSQLGGWGRANKVFGGQLRSLLQDLNERLAA